jgi:integrase
MPTRSTSRDPASTAFLLVEKLKNGDPVWAVKWRSPHGTRPRRRMASAWLAAKRDGSWKPRQGRPVDGALSEFQARRRMPDFVREIEQQRADERERAALEAAGKGPTFRELAHAWLEYVEFVRNAKPSTLRDYRSMLAEPNAPYRRGRGRAVGRVMGAIGDLPACDVTTAHVERILMAHAKEGVGARSVNKHRQTMAAIFNFGLRPEQAEHWRLTKNPAAMAAKRREDPPARMEVFTVEQVELLARTADVRGDQQLGEMIRLAAYTGLRRGELVTLKWRDVHWSDRVLVVERALSGGVEGTTKSRGARYVPLADQPLAALDRLSRRPDFTSADDYVFAGVAGDRLDDSAIRRRYVLARDAAGLPPLRFHDLRHTAGTVLTRVLDPVTVRDVLGHADLKTTERYLHAVRASRLADAATRAFAPEQPTDPTDSARAAFRAAIAQLGPEEARELLDGTG